VEEAAAAAGALQEQAQQLLSAVQVFQLDAAGMPASMATHASLPAPVSASDWKAC
jgi:methyl-accepting chemotaxis protein-1 (serine sensor receptor)